MLRQKGFIKLYTEGWKLSIVPLRPKSKIPDMPWKEFQQRSPGDAELGTWFENGEKGVALVTGFDDLTTFDFDSEAGYFRFFDNRDPATFIVKTRRGYHVHFKNDRPLHSFNVPELSLEVLGRWHLVSAPPSLHESGIPYVVHKMAPLKFTFNIAEFVRSRCEELGIEVKESQPKLTLRHIIGTTEGERHTALLQYAKVMAWKEHLAPEAISDALQRTNATFRPPLKLEEVSEIYEYVIKRELRSSGTNLSLRGKWVTPLSRRNHQ